MINETILTIREYTSRSLNLKRLRALLEILIAFLPIIVLGYIGTSMGPGTLLGGLMVTFGYILSILVASVLLKLRGTGWRQIGLAPPQSWRRTALLAIGTLVLWLGMNIVIQMIAANLPGLAIAPIDQSRFNPLAGNLPLLLMYVMLAWTTITFGEEMMYRAFLINHLAKVFQNARLRWALALVGSSIVFGLVHWVEGPLGMFNAFAMGLLFAAIYLSSGRNLWVTIVAHGLGNTLRFLLLFAGAA